MAITKKEDVNTNTNTTKAVSFSKEQILSAAKFANRRDLLSQILKDDKTYTVEDVENAINKEMGRKV